MDRFNEEIVARNEKAERLVEIIKNLTHQTISGNIVWQELREPGLIKPCVKGKAGKKFTCKYNELEITIDRLSLIFRGAQELSFRLGDYWYDVRYQCSSGDWHTYAEPEDSLSNLIRVIEQRDNDFNSLGFIANLLK